MLAVLFPAYLATKLPFGSAKALRVLIAQFTNLVLKTNGDLQIKERAHAQSREALTCAVD